jgi:hypothetical protein
MSKKEDYVAVIPLTNFDSDVDFISLEDGLCLRRIDGNEIEKLLKLAPGYETTLKVALFDIEFVVEKRSPKKVDYIKWTEKSQNVVNIILALRLLKPGEIFAPTVFFTNSKQRSSYVTNPNPVANALPEPFFLKQREKDEFVELWKKLKQVKKKKPYLIFALKQFPEPFYTLEDQLVNFIMAFESLVFGREKNIPKKYGRIRIPSGRTIGIAISMLLGKSEKERTEIERDLVEAYELRNKIVHGHLKMSKNHEERMSELFDRVEDYLRRSLRKFVEE